MRWFFMVCILLVTSDVVLSKPRPKRDLSYIKNLIASKLFGADTIVIQQPEIPKNETYQLFKIKGYDNILIKVTRKPEKQEKVKVVVKKEDPVMVSPEIAVIGRYLGTRTQSETLIALEIAKNLVKSGILSGRLDETIQQVVMPVSPPQFYHDYIAQEYLKPAQLLFEDRDSVFVYPSLGNQPEKNDLVKHNAVPFYPGNYPPMVITSELKYRPVQTKYSYKQMGENADMTYESYNNQDVIVTRTNKEPPIPQFIKLRFADLASIGANPYLIRSQQPVEVMTEEHLVQPITKIRGSNDYWNPSVMGEVSLPPYVMDRFPIPTKSIPNLEVTEEVGYVVPNSINHPPVIVDRTQLPKPKTKPTYNKYPKLPLQIKDHLTESEVDKMNAIYEEHNISNNSAYVVPPKMSSNNPKQSEESVLKIDKQADADVVNVLNHNKSDGNNSDTNKEVVSKYFYKQMNHSSRDKYTVVKVEDTPKFPKLPDSSKTNGVVKPVDVVPDDFILIPPENIDTPPPVSRTNNIKNSSDETFSETLNYPKGFNISKSKDNSLEPAPLKTNVQHSLKNDPIVVLDTKPKQNENPVRTYRGGKKSFRPYTGGPIF